MNKIIALGLTAALTFSVAAAPKKKVPAKGRKSVAAATIGLPVEQRIDSLLSRMTLDEKIGQLVQYTGAGYNDDRAGQFRAGMVGSLLN